MTGDRDRSRLDTSYLQNGPVTLFLKDSIIEDALAAFRTLGYEVNEVRTDSNECVYEDIGHAYEWAEHFGYTPPNNLNALIDGVTSFNGARRVLVMREFDEYFRRDPNARAFLDVLVNCAQRNLLFGERLALFLQVSDPRFELKYLGATHATWNSAEWMNKERGL